MIARRLLAVGSILAGLWFASGVLTTNAATRSVVVAYASIAMFSTEDAAQAHCRHDAVVWLNTKTGIWHEKGMRWYGRTKQGAYVCRRDAAAAGYRDTENGQ